MNRTICVMALLLGSCVSWTRADVQREGAFGTLMATDMMQTLTITEECSEINPIIGNCGQNVNPLIYFPITMALHVLVMHLLPPNWRSSFQYISIGAELSTVVTNEMNGY